MSGYCEVDFSDTSDDADPVEFFNITTPVARTPHSCCECREQIRKGERYRRIAYKCEGMLSVDCLCESCAEAKAEFEYHIFGGDFWSDMREQWANGANVQGCIARLTTVKAKTLMHRQWMKWKGLEAPPAPDAVDPVGELAKPDPSTRDEKPL